MVTRWLPSIASAFVVAIMSARGLGPISRAIAIACVVLSFLGAALLGRRDVRAHASVVAGIAALTAAGQVKDGWIYGALVALYFATSLVSLRAARGSDARTAPLPIAKILAVTAAFVTAAVLVLPPLAVRVEAFVTGMIGIEGIESTAFSTSMTLGATRGMLQSDAIVLRIENGRDIGYLRGAVYDTYNAPQWITSGLGTRTKVNAEPGGSIQVTLDRRAPVGPDMRWFLPPNACAFDRDLEVDSFGVVRRGGGAAPARLAFSTTGCTPVVGRPPGAHDVEVPPDVRASLGPIAAAVTKDATSAHDKLVALERDGFRGFEYSLAVPRESRLDPIVDFMTVHRAGHCEMFASAMVLMARTQGIPARVVGGYRVTEVNPLTGQSIVRDRNAHAWVEAWYDGTWHAFDPTPAVDGPGGRGSALDHLGDLWSLAGDRLAEIGQLGYAAALGVLIAVLLAIRSLTRWLRRPRRARSLAAMERPLPCFETLLSALAAAGFARDPSEPIETFAGRVPGPASAALGAYAALRYGGVGDERTVVKLVETAASATSSLRPHRS